MTYNTTGRRIRTENLADPATVTLSYDAMGRQTRAVDAAGVTTLAYPNGLTASWAYGSRATKNDKCFVYNGYLQVADNNGNAYVWDPTEPVATRPLVWRHGGEMLFYAHDGNKNVSEVVASDGTLAAHYEYAPFGVLTSQMGALASVNPFRFSSEYVEEDTTTVYYNYRHYEPVTGRWLGRDPIEEQGGVALYGFCANGWPCGLEALGLSWLDFHLGEAPAEVGEWESLIPNFND